MENKYSLLKIILILFSISALNSCKKYPEDGIFSFQTVKKRLVNRTWVVKDFQKGGEDFTDYKYDYGNYNYSIRGAKLRLTDQPIGKDKGGPFWVNFEITSFFDVAPGVVPSSPYNYIEWGGLGRKFYLNGFYLNKRDKLGLNVGTSKGDLPFMKKIGGNEWSIRKLTKDEMILEIIDDDNKLLRIKFSHN